MTKYVALYCRLSPRPDGSYEGVDLQEGWGRDYATKAWPDLPVEVFADRGISAANGDDRPEFERFREWVRDGKIAHLWTVEQSRLERREVEWFQLAAELDAAGIGEVHTNRDGLVQVRGVAAGVKAVINADYVRELKRRVNDRLEANATAGEPPGGHMFGYRHAAVDGTKTYIIVDEQAEAVRWAADRVLDGWSLTNIARELTGRGMRGTHGGKIITTTVRTWLTSPTIAGHRVYQGRIVGRGNWPAILDEQTWQLVKTKLDGPRTVTTTGGDIEVTTAMLTPRAARRYLLTGGLAVCGRCHKPLIGGMTKLGKRGKPKPYLKCHPSKGGSGCVGISSDATEAYVVGELWRQLDRPEFVDALSTDDGANARDLLTAKLSGLDGQREQLAKLWGAGELAGTEWQAARQAIAENEQALRAELAAVPAPVDVLDIAEARAAWDEGDMPLDEQRALLRRFIAKITVDRATTLGPSGFDDKRVVIEWRTLRPGVTAA